MTLSPRLSFSLRLDYVDQLLVTDQVPPFSRRMALDAALKLTTMIRSRVKMDLYWFVKEVGSTFGLDAMTKGQHIFGGIEPRSL